MPVHYPSEAGKPYRPSNGMEGDLFMEQFCCQCKHHSEDDPCDIILRSFFLVRDPVSLCHEIGEPEYPSEWKYDDDGKPTCTAFEKKDA